MRNVPWYVCLYIGGNRALNQWAEAGNFSLSLPQTAIFWGNQDGQISFSPHHLHGISSLRSCGEGGEAKPGVGGKVKRNIYKHLPLLKSLSSGVQRGIFAYFHCPNEGKKTGRERSGRTELVFPFFSPSQPSLPCYWRGAFSH